MSVKLLRNTERYGAILANPPYYGRFPVLRGAWKVCSHLCHLAGHLGEPLLQQVGLADERREPPRPQEPQPPAAAYTSAWVLGCSTTGAASVGSAIPTRQSTL